VPVPDPTRRQVVRWSALAAGSIPLGALLAACGADGGSRAGGTAATTRPRGAGGAATPWWLQGNFAPVHQETEATDLRVVGALPPELHGLYVRNGSNPQHDDSAHWFFGDGMVHGVRLENGRARWYRNRYVHTALYDAGAGFGARVPGGTATQSNVSAFWHGGALLTSGEVGFPYRLSPDDLSTVGIHDFGGVLKSAFTAHPKIDPATGRLHSFGYGFTPPYLTYHVTEPDGRMVHTEVVDIPRSTMMHDFAITDRDVVFWDLPVIFDLQAATKWIQEPRSGAFPYRWDPSAGARIGVMPLGGRASAIAWHDIDPCFVFHGVNAHRDGEQIILDVCRLSSMFAPGEAFGGDLSERRWTVDTVSGTVTDEVVEADRPGELPNRDPRHVGRRNRYDYLVEVRGGGGAPDFGGVIKRDHRTGRRTRWSPPEPVHSGEWLFVPTASDEDAGYLLTFVYDDRTERSHLAVLDATDVTRGPVARVELPQRVPYGFHGTWVPA